MKEYKNNYFREALLHQRYIHNRVNLTFDVIYELKMCMVCLIGLKALHGANDEQKNE